MKRQSSVARRGGYRGQVFAAVLVVILASTSGASAQEPYTYTFSLLGGIGGSLDADPDPGLTNTSYQLGFAMVTEKGAQAGLRIGRMNASGERLEDLLDAELTYATLAGEYFFHDDFYESGFFLGLGGYKLEGTDIFARSQDETALGVVFGASGLFRFSRHFSGLVELSVHWVDFDRAQTFSTLQAGIAYHF